MALASIVVRPLTPLSADTELERLASGVPVLAQNLLREAVKMAATWIAAAAQPEVRLEG